MAGALRYQIILGNTVTDIGSVSYSETDFQHYILATGTTDTQLSFGGVTTADVFYMKSDQAITLNINAAAGTDITIDANKPLVLTGTAITAAYVSNSSGSSANIIWGIWRA